MSHMTLCPIHSVLIFDSCVRCAVEFRTLLTFNGLVGNRYASVEPGDRCNAMTHNSTGSEVSCEEPAGHQGVCDDGEGLTWDHEDDCGCLDTAEEPQP